LVLAVELDLDRLGHGGEVADEVLHELDELDLDPRHIGGHARADLIHHLIGGAAIRGLQSNEEVPLADLGDPTAQLQAGAARVRLHIRRGADDLFDLAQHAVRFGQRGPRRHPVVQDEPALVHLRHESRLQARVRPDAAEHQGGNGEHDEHGPSQQRREQPA
jgi:hypothetical protein